MHLNASQKNRRLSLVQHLQRLGYCFCEGIWIRLLYRWRTVFSLFNLHVDHVARNFQIDRTLEGHRVIEGAMDLYISSDGLIQEGILAPWITNFVF